MSALRHSAVSSLGLGGLLLAIACQPAEGASELKPKDERYRALWAAPALELRFEARDGWHIVPDAVAHLALEAPEGYALLNPVQRGENALEHSEETLVFGLSLERAASGAPEPGPLPIHGSVRFGVCRNDGTVCEIVRRDLRLPAPAPSS